MVLTSVGIVKSVNRCVGYDRCDPADTLIVPAEASEILSLSVISCVEVLAAVRVVESVDLFRYRSGNIYSDGVEVEVMVIVVT